MAPRKRKSTRVKSAIHADSVGQQNDGGDDDNDFVLDDELESYAPKRPRDSENIINIVSKNRNISCDQICLLFLEVAKRLDQHEEFDISYWLAKYVRFVDSLNFNQVALVLANAAQIYVRKVDLTYNFVMRFSEMTTKTLSMVEETKKNAAQIEKAIANGEEPPKKKRTTKKKKDQNEKSGDVGSIPFILFTPEEKFEPEEIITVPAETLHEKVSLTPKIKKSDESLGGSITPITCLRLRKKLMIMKIKKQQKQRQRSRKPIFSCEFSVPSDNHDIPNYANGELTDLDDNTVSGTRRDYFVFMGMVHRSRHTLKLSHNFRPDDVENTPDCSANGTTLLPPDYVENVYNVKLRNPLHYYEELRKELELWNHLGVARHEERVKRCVLITYSIAAEFMMAGKKNVSHTDITMDQYDEIIMKLTNLCKTVPPTIRPISPLSLRNDMSHVPRKYDDSYSDSGIHMESNLITTESDCSFRTPLPPVISSTPQTQNNETPKFSTIDIAQKLMNSELRISVDEGISVCGSNRSSPTQQLLPRLSDLNPLERSLLDPRVELVDFCEPLTDVEKMNMEVKVRENMFYIANVVIPPPQLQTYDVTQQSITLNFLQLPLNKLRRRQEFALGPEFKLLKKLKRKSNTMAERKGLTTIHQLCEVVDDIPRCETPIANNDDFLGFDENGTETLTFLSPNAKQIRSFSHDSGILMNDSQDPVSNNVSLSQFDNSVIENSQSMMSSEPPQITSTPVPVPQERSSVLPEIPSIPDDDDLNSPVAIITSDKPNNRISCLFGVADEDDAEVADRIKDWHMRMRPILSKSQKRSTFDIHAYGKEIIEAFPSQSTFDNTTIHTSTSSYSTSHEMSFAQLMNGREDNMTARYFLTMLQLANNENIVIMPPANRTRDRLVGHDELQLKLIDPVMRAEAMDDSTKFNLYDQQAKRKVILTSTPINPIARIMKRCEGDTNVTGPPIKRRRIENNVSINAVEQISANGGMSGQSGKGNESEFGESGYSSFVSDHER